MYLLHCGDRRLKRHLKTWATKGCLGLHQYLGRTWLLRSSSSKKGRDAPGMQALLPARDCAGGGRLDPNPGCPGPMSRRTRESES